MNYTLGPYLGDGPQPYPVLRHILASYPPGHAVEFGVQTGTSLRLIAAHMPVVGFDSFEGLPEDWRPGYSRGSLKVQRPPYILNADVVAGWFTDTLPSYDFGALGNIGLVHFDADLYSSTKSALTYIGPHLKRGTVCVFDEWFGYTGCEEHEQKAWREYVAYHPLDWDVIGHGDQTWAIRVR